MKNTYGNVLSVTLFGESHGDSVGVVIDGLAPGMDVDEEYINKKLDLRKPKGNISTKRVETDIPHIVSGVFRGKTTGTPLCIIMENSDTKSKDYSKLETVMRPGHADFTAKEKYHGFSDFRGGGHFSGRLTSPIVAAGAIIMQALEKKGIFIGSHIKKCKDVLDRDFGNYVEDINALSDMYFPVLEGTTSDKIYKLIENAAEKGDSVGGTLETAVIGLPSGVGEPWFDSMESRLSHILFSVPAVKGVEFGAGFGFSDMYGSEAKDELYYENGVVLTKKNNNGGINGGITNGMPVIFRTVIKPTSSIYQEQDTIDVSKRENTTLLLEGRHDPAIFHRARVVIDAVTAIAVADALTERFGTDYLR